MPYTTLQRQQASTRYLYYARHRHDFMHQYAVQNALDMLRRFEADYQWQVRCLGADELIECERCDEVIGYMNGFNAVYRHPDDVVEIGDNVYCSADCANSDGYYICEYCGEWYHEYDEVYTQDHGYCSHDCAENDGWHQCERCEEWVHEDDALYIEGNYYCDADCAERDGWRRCESCDEWVAECDTQCVGGDTWCEWCADHHARECDECGELYPEDDIEYDEESDQDLCPHCSGRSVRHYRSCRDTPQRGVVHPYGYRPFLTFFTEKGVWEYSSVRPMFLGVELETDGGRDRQAYANALSEIGEFDEHFWMTHDGSLDNGIEITGHPMTLGAHVALREVYEEISKAALKHGYRSHDGNRCGLHVHVNRGWFGRDKRLQDAGGYKLMRLMQRFEYQFTVFSRRTSDNWCRYKTRTDYKLKDEVSILNRYAKDESGIIQKAYQMLDYEQNHSQCVNFEHANTFEIRIFRGTLKWSTYFASLGLVNGLCHTVRNHGSIWVENVSWYDLMDEVVSRCDEPYARECLENYLAEKNLR